MTKKFTQAEITESLNCALKLLAEKDSHLFQVNANERSISHKLAMHLEQDDEFQEFDIDCEYNRDSRDPKRASGKLIYPDIIIHKRGEPVNILALEIKKKSTASKERSEKDASKLCSLIDEHQYQHAAYIILPDAIYDEASVIWLHKESISLVNQKK